MVIFHRKGHNTAIKLESITYNDMATSMNGENIVQNSVYIHPSIQLLRNLILVSTTAVQVYHHTSPSKNPQTIKRSTTEQIQGPIIDKNFSSCLHDLT